MLDNKRYIERVGAIPAWAIELEHRYDHISIRSTAHTATLLGGLLEPTDHDDYRWVTISELDRYGFAPADVPFVRMLKGGDLIRTAGL